MTHIKKSEIAKQVTFQEYLKKVYNIQIDISKREMLISAPYRQDAHPSLSINNQKQLFNDFATGAKGSIIDFVMVAKGFNFCQALNELTSGSFSFCRPTASAPIEPKEPKEVISEIIPIWSYALKNYLEQERCIPKEVYIKYLKEIRYTRNGKQYYAIGFQSDAGGWELRNKLFKGCVGKKDITHIKNDCNTLLIFEGWADFLSHVSASPDTANFDDYLILNSTSHVRKSLHILDDYEYVECYTDGDDAGYAAGEAFMNHWESIGKQRSKFGYHAPSYCGTDVNGAWIHECKRNNKRA